MNEKKMVTNNLMIFQVSQTPLKLHITIPFFVKRGCLLALLPGKGERALHI